MRLASAWPVVAAAAFAAGCLRYDTQPLPPFDPAATFVAHSVHGGLAIDRIPGAAGGRIEERSFGLFVAYAGDTPIAALRVPSLATVVARTTNDAAARPDVAVTPSWTPEGIRLAIASNDGTLHTGQFVRTDGRAGMATLSRTGQTNLDVRGTFRADALDDGGTPRGWFTVRVPGPGEPRVFAADLQGASIAIGPAVALALVSELDWIDDHSVDVYRGTGRDRGGGHGHGH
jgi:hypothetical protein